MQRLAQIMTGRRQEARFGLRGEFKLLGALVHLAFGATFDDDSTAIFSDALRRNKQLVSLDLSPFKATDAQLCAIVDALKANTTLQHMSLSSTYPFPLSGKLADTLAEFLAANQTLTSLKFSSNSITDAAANKLLAGLAKNTVLKIFSNTCSYFSPIREFHRPLEDKARANASIQTAGIVLAALSHRPKSPVSIPVEVGVSIAAFVAQVAPDTQRSVAMQSILDAAMPG